MVEEKKILIGKTILFVDDRPSSAKYFIEKVKAMGTMVYVRRTIQGAADLLETETIDFAVLDLFLNEPDDRFDQYRDKVVQTGTNQGQLLGLYLQEKQVPYLYLSSNPSWHQENREKEKKKIPNFSKSPRSWDEFIKELRIELEIPDVTTESMNDE